MKRELKFRAWNKLAHKMADITAIDFQFDAYRAIAGKSSGSGHLTDIDLMQFTGLKDKNGKEVFEGDIIRGSTHEFNTIVELIAQVEYDEDQMLQPFYNLWDYDANSWMDCLIDGFEVIGNIHETPELLSDT